MKKYKNGSNLVDSLIIKESISRYLDAFPTFEALSSILSNLISLKNKSSAQNIFFILKNNDLSKLHHSFLGYMGETFLKMDPGAVYLDLLQTLDKANMHPAEIMELMLTPIVYDVNENYMVPLVNFGNKQTLQKYIKFIMQLWDRYNERGVSSNYEHKKPSINEITRLLQVKYFYKKNDSTANLLQYILVNKDKDSFALLMRAFQQHLTNIAADNKSEAEYIFDLISGSIVSGINPAFAKSKINSLSSSYVLATLDPKLSEEMMSLLKNMLTRGLLSEPLTKMLKLLGGFNEHLTSIKDPKDKSLTFRGK